MYNPDIEKRAFQAVNDLTDSELVDLHNRYCRAVNLPDDEIYSDVEWYDDILPVIKPADAFRLGVFCGNFCLADKWISYDSNGNITSTDYVRQWVNIDDIITEAAERGEAENSPLEWFADC